MKFLVILFAAFLLFPVQRAMAQYEETMIETINAIDSSKSAEEFLELSNKFLRIAEAEPKQWLPEYYAAFTTVIYSTFVQDNKEKDKLLNSAMDLINKAEAKLKDNAEILTMKAFILQMQVGVDPMARGMKLGMESEQLISKAIELSPGNPRPLLLRGESLFYTPEQFGGGKAKAKIWLEKAIEKYKTFTPESPIHPNWGRQEAEKLLEQC